MKKVTEQVFSFQEAEESSGFLLWQVTSLWQRMIRKALEPLQITHAQYVLLASIHWLTLHKQEVTQVKLSQHTKIDPMTTSQVLRTLQQKGLVFRKEHPVDTRAKLTGLTEAGIVLVKQAVPIVEGFDANFFAILQDKQPLFNKLALQLLEQPQAD